MNFDGLIERCIAEMADKNLTNKDVAKLAEISEATVSRALNHGGQNMTVATLNAICDALGIELDGGSYTAEPIQANVAEVYEARIADLKQALAYKNKWLKVMAVALGVVVGFILVILAIDLANPNVGWFREALGLGEKLWRRML